MPPKSGKGFPKIYGVPGKRPKDMKIKCDMCRAVFTHSKEEQQVYTQKKYEQPLRCENCRTVVKAAKKVAFRRTKKTPA